MGQPKAWLPFGPERLLQRLVRQVSLAVSPVLVVSATDQDLPSVDVPIVRDSAPDCGPLEGLATGLKALQGQVDAAFVTSCDVPFLRPTLIRRLIELLDDRWACVPRIDGRWHPLTAVYRLEALEIALQMLAAGQRRMIDLVQSLPTRIVEAVELRDVDPTLASFRNVNTPEDYASALREFALVCQPDDASARSS